MKNFTKKILGVSFIFAILIVLCTQTASAANEITIKTSVTSDPFFADSNGMGNLRLTISTDTEEATSVSVAARADGDNNTTTRPISSTDVFKNKKASVSINDLYKNKRYILSFRVEVKNSNTPAIFSEKIETTEKAQIKEIKNETTIQIITKDKDGNIIDVKPESDKVKADSQYKLLAPIPGFLEETPKNPGEYINGMYKILLGFAGALAVMMIMYAGFMYMTTEAVSGKTKAKERITGAVLGLILALSSYLILKTINPDFVKFNLDIGVVDFKIDEEIHGDTGHKAVNGLFCNGRYKDGEAWKSDTTERTELLQNKIFINKENCTKVGEKNCTSLYGVKTAPVINLQKECLVFSKDCAIVISGGSECWLHSQKTNHLPNKDIVDISFKSASFDKFVNQNFEKVGMSSLGPILQKKKGSTKLLKENNHYHVLNW